MRKPLASAVLAVLIGTSSLVAYDPPIGIPAPPFGVDESHMMFVDGIYDFGSIARSYPNSGHGPYTHYVDNTHPDATNENNPFGSPDRPRCDMFDRWSCTLKAGSVVEIHGGPYNYTGWRKIISEGTAELPVFVRGVGLHGRVRTQAGPREQHDLRIEGSYLIIENQEYYDGAYFRIWPHAHHIAVRDCEIHNPENRWISTGSVLSIGKSCKDIVAYRNHIHHNRRLKTPPDTPEDLHGVTIGAAAERVWVLGNHIHHNSGDAFQAAHRAIPAPRFVYVGGNDFHHDRENGVDLKSIEDVVVSQNVIHGYQSSATSAGDAIVVGSNGLDPAAPYGPRRSWILFNEIRDSLTGIRVEGAADCGIVGNTIHGLAGHGITLVPQPITSESGQLPQVSTEEWKPVLIVISNVYIRSISWWTRMERHGRREMLGTLGHSSGPVRILRMPLDESFQVGRRVRQDDAEIVKNRSRERSPTCHQMM